MKSKFCLGASNTKRFLPPLPVLPSLASSCFRCFRVYLTLYPRTFCTMCSLAAKGLLCSPVFLKRWSRERTEGYFAKKENFLNNGLRVWYTFLWICSRFWEFDQLKWIKEWVSLYFGGGGLIWNKFKLSLINVHGAGSIWKKAKFFGFKNFAS